MSDWINVSESHSPGSVADAAAIIQQASAAETPVYPIGGGTALDYGLPGSDAGYGLSLSALNSIVDYPSRDMTITVESGVTMGAIATALAENNQRLPLDVPHTETATIGGVVAVNSNGPRRYSQGTVRDFVIGIEAIDGRGTVFKGGGRVVKNVAGYDFCKLLTGSLGTLAVITKLTLKVKPQPTTHGWLVYPVQELQAIDPLLESLTTTTPVPLAAIELVGGGDWSSTLQLEPAASYLLLALEGTKTEVDWMVDTLQKNHPELCAARLVEGNESTSIWQALSNFPANTDAALTVQLSIRNSGLIAGIQSIMELDEGASWMSHAGSGLIVAHFPELPEIGVSRAVTGTLRTATALADGHVSILRNPNRAELSRNSVWGAPASLSLMQSVKNQFDPHNILNRGRFVY